VKFPVITEVAKAELTFRYIRDKDGNIVDVYAISFVDGSEHRTPAELTRHLQARGYPYQSARFFGDVYRAEWDRLVVK